MSTCDNTSVGILIRDEHGRYLMFERATPPPGVAPPAGHIDDHGSPADAARAEVAEEVGLAVATLIPLLEGWRPNRCRRDTGVVGHYWHIYAADVTGQLSPSPRETRNARWLTPADIQALVTVTIARARGELTAAEFAEQPGIEPVWVGWLAAADVIETTADELLAIEKLT